MNPHRRRELGSKMAWCVSVCTVTLWKLFHAHQNSLGSRTHGQNAGYINQLSDNCNNYIFGQLQVLLPTICIRAPNLNGNLQLSVDVGRTCYTYCLHPDSAKIKLIKLPRDRMRMHAQIFRLDLSCMTVLTCHRSRITASHNNLHTCNSKEQASM